MIPTHLAKKMVLYVIKDISRSRFPFRTSRLFIHKWRKSIVEREGHNQEREQTESITMEVDVVYIEVEWFLYSKVYYVMKWKQREREKDSTDRFHWFQWCFT